MARPREVRSLPAWKNHDWQSDDWTQIHSSLVGRRKEIAVLLDIDPAAAEARVRSEKLLGDRHGHSFENYFVMRRAGGRVEFVLTIDLIIDDMTQVLHDFVVSQVNGKLHLSEAKVRGIIEQIAGHDSITESEIELLPLPVLHVLAVHYPGEREEFAPGLVEPEAVIAAAEHFLASTPVPGRGRPKGTANIDAGTLTTELANIFVNCGTRQPGRNPVPIPETHEKRETGEFYEFLKLAFESLPHGISPTRNGGSVATLARNEIEKRKNLARSKK